MIFKNFFFLKKCTILLNQNIIFYFFSNIYKKMTKLVIYKTNKE